MRNWLITVVGCLSLVMNVNAQELHVQPAENSAFFGNAWQMQYAMLNGQKVGQGDNSAKTTFGFKTDGTFIVRGNDGKDTFGKWTYYFDKKYIDLTSKGKIISRVKSFTKDLIIMTLVAPEGATDPMGAVEIHFMPIY